MSPPDTSQRPLLVPALSGLAALLCYLWTAGPTFYWLDSSELAAAAWGLGVAHPPGHPLPSLLARLTCMLPLGTLAFRVTLACALAAALAVAATALLAEQLLARLLPPPGSTALRLGRRLACAAAALDVGLSYALWFQAVRAEVYALNVALIAVAAALVLAWERRGDARPLYAAALVVGLALANHHLLVLLALPPLAVFVLWRARAVRRAAPASAAPGRRLLLGVLALSVLGLSTLAYLPLRARRAPVVDWGSPSTVERLAWTVSARAFHKAIDRAARESVAHRAGGAFFALLGGLGPVAALAALGGLYLAARRRAARPAALLLVALCATNLASPLIVGFDPMNPDAHGYLAVAGALAAPGLAALIAVAAEATAALRGVAGRAAPVALAVASLALPAYQALVAAPACDLRRHWAAEETARATLALPPGSLALSAYFETIFNAWALEVTADARPDLAIVHRGFLGMPGYAEAQARRHPELAPLLEALRAGPGAAARELRSLAARRPILLEAEADLGVLGRGLRPAGLLLRWGDEATPRPDELARHQQAIAAWERAVGADAAAESETRRALVWAHYQLARIACDRRWDGLYRLHGGRAMALAPRDRKLGRLVERCGKPQ